jgi:hypothetical protein
MVGMLSPWMAVTNDEITATTVKPPKMVPTAAGCLKVAPLVTTAEKHPISDWVELAKILKMASPSKSGMLNASGGMFATSFWLIGMMPLALIGVSACSGQALRCSVSVPR